MEKPQLTQEQLEQLKAQYYDLTEEVRRDRKLMKTRRFRDAPAEKQRILKMQYTFYRCAIEDGLRVLIDHDHVSEDLLCHVVLNRELRLKTRWWALKQLYKTRTIS